MKSGSISSFSVCILTHTQTQAVLSIKKKSLLENFRQVFEARIRSETTLAVNVEIVKFLFLNLSLNIKISI